VTATLPPDADRTADPSRPIDAVVFDFGGVFTPSPFDAVEVLAARLDIEPAAAMLHVFGPYDRDTDHPWHQAERGEIDIQATRDAIAEAARADGLEIDLFEVFSLISASGGDVRPAMVERTRRLRGEGYRTALVTNNVAEFRDYWRPMIPLDELFDAVIDSSEVGLRKPDRRIYELALDRLGGIDPTRSVFLDDYPGNIDAAEALGMTGVLVDDAYDDAIARLDQILGPARA
jgi:epoxide hydrolase-like predicted phosphatase